MPPTGGRPIIGSVPPKPQEKGNRMSDEWGAPPTEGTDYDDEFDENATEDYDEGIEIDLAREQAKPGTHKLALTEARTQGPGPSGYQYIRMKAVVSEGEQEGAETNGMLSMSPAARFTVRKFLDAIDAPRQGTLNSRDLVGKEFIADVEWDEEREESRIEDYRKPDYFEKLAEQQAAEEAAEEDPEDEEEPEEGTLAKALQESEEQDDEEAEE